MNNSITIHLHPREAKRIVTILALATLLFSKQVDTALAHAKLIASSPTTNATVAPPNEIVLTFNEAADPIFVKLRDSNGAEMQGLSKPVIKGNEVHCAFEQALSPGRYTVEYRVVTTDAHAISGKVAFAVK